MLLSVPVARSSLAKPEGSLDRRAPLLQWAGGADRQLPWRVSCTPHAVGAGRGIDLPAAAGPAVAGSVLALAGLSKGRRRVWKKASLVGLRVRRASLVQAHCRGECGDISLPAAATGSSGAAASQSWRRRQQLLLGLAVFPAAGACSTPGSSAEAAEAAVATGVSRLLEQQPALRGFAERFRPLQLRFAQAQGDNEAAPAALDAIIDFLESKAAASELGILGDRERDIWAEVEKSGTAGAEQIIFLKEYYSFWSSFNTLFGSALVSLSNTLQQSPASAAVVSDIVNIMTLDSQSGKFEGNVDMLQGLFRRMTKFRRGRQKNFDSGLQRNQKDSLANSDAASKEAAGLIRTYCKDGKYAPGLGALIDLEVVLLQYLRAVVAGELPEFPEVLAQLNIFEDSGTGVTKRKVVLQLYRIQGVFSFLNFFQDEVLTSIDNRK